MGQKFSFISESTNLRKFRIYYLNNKKTTILILIFLFLIISSFFYFLNDIFFNERVVYVSYKYEETDEVWISDGEAKSSIDNMEDTRPLFCSGQAYDFTRMFDIRETVSIITHFHGNRNLGHFKILINSIINFTPIDIYEEIIIIIDGYINNNYQEKLNKFLNNDKFEKVKLFRSESKEGLGNTRQKASLIAKGTILIFISSHVIVNLGWIQPLIAKVVSEPKSIAIPHYDNMLSGHRFFKIEENYLNVFTWNFFILFQENFYDKNFEFIDSLIMRGEVLAIKKDFFNELGGYDGGLEPFGGGENLEFSLRIWMCGGKITIAKCSRVAVHSSTKPIFISSVSNFQRINELWFDNYKNIVYKQGNISSIISEKSKQSIEERKKYLKEKLQCKTMEWYMNNVAKDMLIIPMKNFKYFGKLKTKTAYCLKTVSEVDIEMDLCRHHIYIPSMIFQMDEDGVISQGELCLSVDISGLETGVENKIILNLCEEKSQNKKWFFRGNELILKSKSHLCLVHENMRSQKTNQLQHFAKLDQCGSVEKRKKIWEFINY